MRSIKPIFLFADSQILFWNPKEGQFIKRLRDTIESDENRPKGEMTAAYIGASNNDQAEYFGIFTAAMKQIDLTNCRHIPAKPDSEDYAFLRTADLVLLSGGDTKLGWDAISNSELQQKIVECYHNGAVLVGISAGAVQLGLRGWEGEQSAVTDDEKKQRLGTLFETFQIVPAVIDVHDPDDWEGLQTIVKHLGNTNRGYGIPAGGGAVYHPDWSFEAIRHHLVEISCLDDEIKRSLVFPKSDSMPDVLENDDENRGKIIKPDEVMSSGIINIDPDIIEH